MENTNFKVAEVIVDVQASSVDKIFDYKISDDIKLGARVKVPFGPRVIEGYVVKIKNSTNYDQQKLKDVICQVDNFEILSPERVELLWFMKEKYNLKLIDILRLFLPSELRAGKVKELTKTFYKLNANFEVEKYAQNLRKNSTKKLALIEYLKEVEKEEKSVLVKNFSLSTLKKLEEENVIEKEQEQIFRTPEVNIVQNKQIVWTKEQEKAIDELKKFECKTYLLHGVTGSGKTEVYIASINEALKKGKTAILLVPEISLTPQVLSHLKSRFGDLVAILHSGLSAGERFDEWLRIIKKQAKVVIGARSAIFAPLEDVGIIIIDEEHDSSYSSESNPRYSTHVIAEFRKNYNKCPLVLGSATPSVESYYFATQGKYKLLELKQRINQKGLPSVEIVDMLSELRQGNTSIFSVSMLAGLKNCIENKKQAMIFINRRGYSSFMMCRDCGYLAKCDDCDVSLVYHRQEEKLKCHYCGKSYKALTCCPNCKSLSIKQGAVGTERVVKELAEIFPNVKILRMDNDTTQNKNSHQKILNEFAKSLPAVLVGTQMIAKGHDFKDVTFVGIVDADQSLFHSAYKSTEKTFQLITQMSGRAGRDEDEGKVVLQTYTPRHYVYRFASNHDYIGFFKKEINLRQTTKFPPFSQIVRLLFSSENDSLLLETVKEIYEKILLLATEYKPHFYYVNAMKSPIKRIQKKYRYQILMRITKEKEDEIIQKIYQIMNSSKFTNIKAFVEINPQNLS